MAAVSSVQGSSFMIASDLVPGEEEVEAFMRERIEAIKSRALPPISHYHVGAAVLASSHKVYLGVNLEFPGVPLSQTVHAEQFAIAHARAQGEKSLLHLMVSAFPCGHCRQFMAELGGGLAVGDQEMSDLLPHAFGPKDLGLEATLMDHEVHEEEPTQQGMADAALLASYAPYSHAPSGVVLSLRDGTFVRGSYLENAAFNPSLPPLQAALIELVAAGRTYDEIVGALLVEHEEAPISQEVMTREILRQIAPTVSLSMERR
jgi:cytidine deaminase